MKLFRASLVAQPDVAVVCAGSAVHAMQMQEFVLISIWKFCPDFYLEGINGFSVDLLNLESCPAAIKKRILKYGKVLFDETTS